MRQALAQRPRAQRTGSMAPTRGLVLAQNPTQPMPGTAEVVENWIPTDRGLRVRGGLVKSATTEGTAISSLFTYKSAAAEKMFAATATALYDMSNLTPTTAPTPVIADQTAGYYSTQQIGTVGGDYLIAVNGADLGWVFDGGNWNPITTTAVREIDYDAGTAAFTKGQTLTGGTSGATATILAVIPATGTTGTLKIGPVTSGPFQDNEALTDGGGGSATADGADTEVSTLAITGVATSSLSSVWLYQSRLFFVEKDSLKAWYLPVDSIGGAAADISLAGVFQRGGTLLFGATWSIDTGAGLDDKCVFVTTEGEVAIYSGTNPGSASTWALEGRYDIAAPLGKNGYMSAGGDLIIATDEGMVPLSAAITKDPAALELSAVSRPIETLWSFEAERATSPVEIIKWSSKSLGIVTFPQADHALTVNLQTGAWAKQTGWTATCGTTFAGKAYIGRSDGLIMSLDDGGKDDTEPYTARLCGAFQDYGDPTAYKVAAAMRAVFYALTDFRFKLSVAVDYRTDFPAAPTGVDVMSDFLVWDVGDWDVGLWWSDAAVKATQGLIEEYRGVSGAGYALAPQVQITISQTDKPNIELIRCDLIYEVGGAVV